MELIEYLFKSSFWMWSICVICVICALYFWLQEHKTMRYWKQIFLAILFALLAYGFGSVAHHNGVNNCVNAIVKAEQDSDVWLQKHVGSNVNTEYMPFQVKRAICENI